MEPKTGIVRIHDEYSEIHSARLVLHADALLIQMQEWVSMPLDDEDELFLNMIREVEIARNGGSLGLCVKGGAEHRLPVLVSRVVEHSPADQCKQLLVGDAILRVNGDNVEGCTHREVVSMLKGGGEAVVRLSVRHFRPASHFLNIGSGRGDNELCPAPAGDDRARDGNVDESNHSYYKPVLPRLQKQYLTSVTIPLLYARITWTADAVDTPRSYDGCALTKAFKVFGVDGSHSGAIIVDGHPNAYDWSVGISSNIRSLLARMVSVTNRCLPPDEQIGHMVWCRQRVPVDSQRDTWKAVYLCLKSHHVYIFSTPPMHSTDWTVCEVQFPIHECSFRILKDGGRALLSDRLHLCCSIHRAGHGDPVLLSMDGRDDLMQLSAAWKRVSDYAITRLASETFECLWRGQRCSFTVDINRGFSLHDIEPGMFQSVLWMYRFSQLRSSSDDGQGRLNLCFLCDRSKMVVCQVLECRNIEAVLFSIHGFLSAKLSAVDPGFASMR